MYLFNVAVDLARADAWGSDPTGFERAGCPAGEVVPSLFGPVGIEGSRA